MAGIVGNALGFDHERSVDELSARFDGFSLRNLLDQDANAPMLVVNGADDVHVPQHDTQVFQGRRDTEVHLIADTGAPPRVEARRFVSYSGKPSAMKSSRRLSPRERSWLSWPTMNSTVCIGCSRTASQRIAPN
jgi:hypothetical protein